MKKIYHVLILLVLTHVCFSQEKLNPLTMPNSPAASILGMQPSVQLKPKSFRALETALYSNFTDENGNGVIPNDFGLEFTPYWALKKGITLEEYLYPKSELMQIVQNSSFSLASTQNFILQDSTQTKSIALGYRTSLFFGNTNDKEKIKGFITNLDQILNIETPIIQTLDQLKDNDSTAIKEDYILELQKIVPKIVHDELKTKSKKEADLIAEKIIEEANELNFDPNQIDTFFESIIEIVKAKVGGNYTDFESYIKARQGFSLDFAAAIHLNFPDNNFEFSEVPKYSLWLSPSYNFSNKLDFLKASATLRYERFYIDYFKKYFSNSNVFENNIDYGGSISGTFKKFTIEFEITGRRANSLLEVGQDAQGNSLFQKKDFNDTQYIGTFSYRLNEQIALTYQFGSGFEPVFNVNGGNLISVLSLNFGFGGPDKNDMETSKP